MNACPNLYLSAFVLAFVGGLKEIAFLIRQFTPLGFVVPPTQRGEMYDWDLIEMTIREYGGIRGSLRGLGY
jgi:hypothetical protein